MVDIILEIDLSMRKKMVYKNKEKKNKQNFFTVNWTGWCTEQLLAAYYSIRI